MLRAHGVRAVIDVRRHPGSRRHPQFARDALARSLPAEGLGYVHEPELGGRRRPLPGTQNTAWRNEQFRGYADHLASAEFESALARVLTYPEPPVALMCAEAVPWRCHRQLIADVLVARGHDVRHVLSVDRADAHRLDPKARVSGGRVIYPAEPETASAQLELLADPPRGARR